MIIYYAGVIKHLSDSYENMTSAINSLSSTKEQQLFREVFDLQDKVMDLIRRTMIAAVEKSKNQQT